MNSNILFYIGTIIIIVFFIGLLIKRFKDDDEINLEKHKWIILTYIVLLIMAIFSWRILFLMIKKPMTQISNYTKSMEIINNEE